MRTLKKFNDVETERDCDTDSFGHESAEVHIRKNISQNIYKKQPFVQNRGKLQMERR